MALVQNWKSLWLNQILHDTNPVFQPWGGLDVLHMKRDPNPNPDL